MSGQSWILPSCLSLVIWGVSAFLPKVAVQRLKPLHVLVYQMGFFFASAVAVQAFYGFDLTIPPLPTLALAVSIGVMGATGQVFYLIALKNGPVSRITVMTSLYPVAAMFLAMLLLHETLSLRQSGGVLLGLVAIILIVKTGNARRKKDSVSPIAWVLPSAAAFVFWGFWSFLPKIALETLPPHELIFFESLGNLCVAAVVAGFGKFKLTYDRKAVAISGITSLMGVLAILSYFYALRAGPVSIIVTLTALYPVVSVILARVFLKEDINRRQVLAITTGIVAAMLLAG